MRGICEASGNHRNQSVATTLTFKKHIGMSRQLLVLGLTDSCCPQITGPFSWSSFPPASQDRPDIRSSAAAQSVSTLETVILASIFVELIALDSLFIFHAQSSLRARMQHYFE